MFINNIIPVKNQNDGLDNFLKAQTQTTRKEGGGEGGKLNENAFPPCRRRKSKIKNMKKKGKKQTPNL
jgi:hypothetical protein